MKYVLTRRAFAGSAALGALTIADPRRIAQGQEEEKTSPHQAEIDARMAMILARYGDRLDDDARNAVRADVEDHLRRMRILKQVPLENGEGPCPLFIPYRGPGE